MINLRRGFSSPGFDQGKQSEYDAACDAATTAIKKAWEECGDVPFPLYEDEAKKLGMAAVDAIRALGQRGKHDQRICDGCRGESRS